MCLVIKYIFDQMRTENPFMFIFVKVFQEKKFG